MERLIGWIHNFNTSNYDESIFANTLDDTSIRLLTVWYSEMLRNLYVKRSNPDDYTNNPFRSSQLGKPALVTAYNYYHPNNSCNDSDISNPNKRRMESGHVFEMWVATQLIRLGYEVTYNVSAKLQIMQQDINCHVDLIVHDGDSKVIIECKEISDWYFKQWYGKRYSQPDDDRGYLTQASVYSQAFNMPVIWILSNRQTGELGYVVLDKETKDECLDRVKEIVDVLVNKTNSWEECFKYMRPEPPNVTKNGLTVPFAMKPIKDLVYKLDNKGYVLDYKYPKGYEDYKPEI